MAASEQIPIELEQLQAELECEKENYENARSAVEQAELARERKKKHLRDGHEIYESRLALKIQASKNGEPSPYSGVVTISVLAHSLRVSVRVSVLRFEMW